ncbi:MAG: malate permease [Acetobacterium sp.]|nr:malate permease [Acetobacterium sp.]
MISLAGIFYVVIIFVIRLLSKILYLKDDKSRVFQFAFIFGNTGFVGVPLVAVLLQSEGILYFSLFAIIDQLIFWTYGLYLAKSFNERFRSSLFKTYCSDQIATPVLEKFKHRAVISLSER